MAHESQYSNQFLLGVNPVIQGSEVEGNSDLLGIEMLEAPSKHGLSADHFSKSFAGYQDLLDSSNTAASAWQLLDSSSSSPTSLFEGSERMNMKLSLSLLSTKPPSALPEFMHQVQPKTTAYHHHRQQQQQQQQLFDLKKSVHLKAAQELLIECCSLEGGSSSKERVKRASNWELEREPTASILQPSLYSMNHLELHSLKIKLFSMLEEVEKRYRKYCHQMQTTASMLESAAGEGAADVYSTLASKAMSRHFRRLKDGIVGQLNAAKRAMGEKDDDRSATGMTRGKTPRLRLLDQCVRQHKALQQGMAHQQLPWRPQRGLPEHSVSILRAWLFEHFLHPYPSDVDKIILARQSGLSRSQVSNWFINARVRIWKPMVEEMYLEEMKELDNYHPNHHQHINAGRGQNPNPKPSSHITDQKPSLPVQLLNVVDSGSLSSIVNGGHHGDGSFDLHRVAGPENVGAGVVGFDFSTAYSSFPGDSSRKSSVSLTLGLQQHRGGGMSLSFSPPSQHSIVFSTEHIDRGQQVDFSVLDGRRRRFSTVT